MRALLTLATVFVLGLAVPATVRAHPLVEAGVREYQDAQFEAALDAFARAEAASDLEREDVVQLLLYRALVYSALGIDAERDRALVALASIEPDTSFDQRTPPVVQEAFEQARARVQQPLGVRSRARTTPGAVEVEARAVDDPANLVREVRVAARAPGGEWVRGTDSVSIPSAEGAVEHYAELVGPGGAVLARHGSVDSPLLHRGAVAVHGGAGEPLEAEQEEEEGGGAWIWIAVGGTVAVAAAVVVIVLLAGQGPGDTTRIDGPAPL